MAPAPVREAPPSCTAARVVEVQVQYGITPGQIRGRTEVAEPVFRVPLPAVSDSSYVFGAMKSRGAPAPADKLVQVKEVRGKGGPYTPLDRPLAGRIDVGPARTPLFPSNERWSPVTLMRSPHPKPTRAVGADSTDRRFCR